MDSLQAKGGCVNAPWLGGSNSDGQVGHCSFLEGEAILSQQSGWWILFGVGSALALLTMTMMFLTIRYDRGKRYRLTADNFTTANRLMGPGFTASVLVSQWTWVATLVQSSNMAWRYGIAGPFWYAAGAAVQLVLFSVLAVQVKRNAPGAHTLCEIVLARWGDSAHIVFICFSLLTNIVVTTMLIMGGANVLSALTGISRIGCAVALPLVVTAYTVQGGFRATYLASVWHNILMFVASLVFCFRIFTSDSELGNPDRVYKRLVDLGSAFPVEGNHDGSFLTFWSQQGVLFGVMNIVGNFGTVFVDQCFWQTAFACKNPLAARRGFILGGLAWFSIPFAMATAMGLGARALNLPLTPEEADMGLVPAAVALHLFGTTGAVVFALQVVTAVASSGSSQQLAVASIVTFDIYKRYINHEATGRQVIRMSRLIILLFGCVSGPLAILVTDGIGLSLDWIYSSQGIFLGSPVIPIIFCLMWKDCSGLGAITGAVGGLCLGIMSWTAAAHVLFGGVTVVTLRKDYPVVIGNLVSILSSGVIAVVMSLVKPQRFAWCDMRAMMRCFLVDPLIGVADELESRFEETMYEQSKRVMRRGVVYSSVITFVLIVFWPLLALCENVLSPAHFKVWVSLSIGWAVVCCIIILALPLFEARGSAMRMFTSAFEKAGEIASMVASSLNSSMPSTPGHSCDHSLTKTWMASSDPAKIMMPRIIFPDSSTVRGILKRIPSDRTVSDSDQATSGGMWYTPRWTASNAAAAGSQQFARQTWLTDVEAAVDPAASSDVDASLKPLASTDAASDECNVQAARRTRRPSSLTIECDECDVHLVIDPHQSAQVCPKLDGQCDGRKSEEGYDVEIEMGGYQEKARRTGSVAPSGPSQQSPNSYSLRFSGSQNRLEGLGTGSASSFDDSAQLNTLPFTLRAISPARGFRRAPSPNLGGPDVPGENSDGGQYPTDVSVPGMDLCLASRPRF